MAYSHTTITQAEDAVLLRLSDPAGIRFPRDEVNLCIAESLRTFGALTGMWLEAAVAAIPANTDIFDIPTYFPTLRPYTLTERDLIGLMQYHLWEPKSVAAWTGSEMFTMADLTQAIQRRRDQFLLETGARITRHNPIPDAPATIDPGGIELDQSIMAIRRGAWNDLLSGRTTPIWPSSDIAMRAASATWNQDAGVLAAVPRTYIFNARTPQLIEFGPPPAAAGTLDLLTVDAGATLDPAIGVLLGIPDDFAWVIKYGALADLYAKDGPARDYAKSLFCERRWQIGIAAFGSVQSVNDGRINGLPAQFSSIAGLDMGDPLWQSKRSRSNNPPLVLAPIGMNLCAITPAPSVGVSLELRLVRNVPIPTIASPYLQIGKEYLDVLYGYAAHVAMLKVGGQELAATTHLAAAFFQSASDFNDRLKNNSVFEAAALGEPDKDDRTAKARGVRRVTGSTVAQSQGPQGG